MSGVCHPLRRSIACAQTGLFDVIQSCVGQKAGHGAALADELDDVEQPVCAHAIDSEAG